MRQAAKQLARLPPENDSGQYYSMLNYRRTPRKTARIGRLVLIPSPDRRSGSERWGGQTGLFDTEERLLAARKGGPPPLDAVPWLVSERLGKRNADRPRCSRSAGGAVWHRGSPNSRPCCVQAAGPMVTGCPVLPPTTILTRGERVPGGAVIFCGGC